MTTKQEVSGWAVGWTGFAGMMMILLGFFHGIAGLAAILENELYVLTADYVLRFDVTAWGWIHLAFGVLVFVAGWALFAGAVWARTIGVILAAISILANFAWLPWYPLWSIVMIAVGSFVIWALTVHGRDMADHL